MTNPRRLLKDQCSYCEKTIVDTRLLCKSCKVVEYCSEEHQTAGRPTHQKECEATAFFLATREEQAKIIREDPDGNGFESTSYFWSISENRAYTIACVALVQNLSQIRTVNACESALKYGYDWLILNWAVDHHNVRHRVAALDIRLGNDQDAYDFMKWYATTGTDPHYGWSSMYDLDNEDVLESLEAGKWTDNETHLSTIASITLLKLRIWFNLVWLQKAELLAHKLPQEILDYLREEFIATGIVANNPRIMQDIRSGKDLRTLYIKPLEQQLVDMFSAIQRKHADFWPAIVGSKSVTTTEESPDDLQLELIPAVSAVREAWEETPGAIEWAQVQLQQRESRTGHVP